MGDILGSIFGSGQQTEQKTVPDVYAQALNKMRVEQLSNLFTNAPLGNVNTATGGGLSNLISTQGYEDLGQNMLGNFLNLGLDAGSNYISKIATPQIMSTAAMQGQEGGGVVPEAIAKAGAQYTLPFLQSLMGASSNFLTSIPGASANITQAPANYAATLLTGIPFSPGSNTSGSKSSLPLFNLFGMGGAA